MRKTVAKKALAAPQSQTEQKQDPVLRKAGGHHHDRDSTDRAANHEEPALAQGRADLRLTHEPGRSAGPERVVEFEPIRDIERQTDRRPDPQSIEQRGSTGSQGFFSRPVSTHRCATVVTIALFVTTEERVEGRERPGTQMIIRTSYVADHAAAVRTGSPA